MRFTVGDAARFMRVAVKEKDTSPETVNQIKKFLVIEDKMAVVNIPLKKIAIAALHMLNVEHDSKEDEEVKYFIEMFKNMDY